MTYSKEARTALFWGVCIPLRTYLATRGDRVDLRAFALVIGTRWVAGLENGELVTVDLGSGEVSSRVQLGDGFVWSLLHVPGEKRLFAGLGAQRRDRADLDRKDWRPMVLGVSQDTFRTSPDA